MAKNVGFACSLKRQWLDKAVQLLQDDLDEAEYKSALNEYLSYEIESPTRLRKTCKILMDVWNNNSVEIRPVRNTALELIEKYPECSATIHLCMMCVAYPVVADVCRLMSRLFEFSDEITNTVLRQKLYDEWGERGTLQTTCRRVTLTLRELDILECPTKGRYKLIRKTINKDSVISFLLYIAMKKDGNAYYTFSDLNTLSLLFPFDFKINKELLMSDDRFQCTNFGGELTVSLKENG